jgi:curved DNA-binding protein CbpA
VDILRLGLTADEATLFAQVGKVAKIGDLLAKSGRAEPAAIALLLSLRAKGAIVPARVSAAAPVSVDAALLEQVDLDPERKKEILAREKALKAHNHYEVLEVPPGASAQEAKEAYYALSRKFHPDRFYGKNLGSFRARVERIFRRIHEAHSVLSDDAKRAAYLKAHPELVPKQQPAAEPTPAPRSQVDAARDAERRARLARHPYLARAVRSTTLLNRGKEALESGSYAEAYAHLQKASLMGPEGAQAPELLQESKRKHEQARAREALQAGNQAKAAGKLEEALRYFRLAASMDPNLSTAAWRAAELMLESGDSGEEAHKLARQAVTAEPRRADYHVTLGKVLLARDTKEARKAARDHFEEALRIDPDHEEAKKGLKKTRRLF